MDTKNYDGIPMRIVSPINTTLWTRLYLLARSFKTVYNGFYLFSGFLTGNLKKNTIGRSFDSPLPNLLFLSRLNPSNQSFARTWISRGKHLPASTVVRLVLYPLPLFSKRPPLLKKKGRGGIQEQPNYGSGSSFPVEKTENL